jgi:phospholipase C
MWERLEQAEAKRLTRRLDRRPARPLPRPGQPPGSDLLPQIKHIVVVMMENHSYDNYLGMLSGRGDGFPLGPDGQPAAVNHGAGPDGTGPEVRAFRQPTTVQRRNVPSQSWHGSHRQWGEGAHDGFVTSAQVAVAEASVDGQDREPAPAATVPARNPADPATTAMGYWTEEDLPFYYGLARTFPLADRWFSSCLGPTFPNRRFLIAGTAHGLIDDSPYDLLDYPPGGTIFDLLTRYGISWVNYHPGAADQPRWQHFARHQQKMARRRLQSARQLLPPHSSATVEKDLQFTADVYPFGISRYMRHIHGLDQFFADAKDGTLPAFSIVDPDFQAFSEENPQDIRKGESFAAAVINAVLHGRGWPDTLLIWVYDEHGGYYDHVPPPAAVPPDDIEGRSLIGTRSRLERLLGPVAPGLVRGKRSQTEGPHRYDRYGFRVPAVIVSPYARPDYVCHEVLDHTSVLRLVEEKWNLPPLTARDAAAATPLDALDLAGEPAFLNPPDLPGSSLAWGSW